MITEEDYARDCLSKGIRGHKHDGVWWREVAPFYARPMFEFRQFEPGSCRPSRLRAPLFYSHHVPSLLQGNRFVDYLILEGEDLADFNLQRLRGKKRNQVRKGLRLCEVRRIEDVASHIERIRQIYISQSRRHTEHHELPDTPPEFYIEKADAWRRRELRHLTTGGREVWGAFIDGELGSFLVSFQVEGVRFIEKMKSHTDAFKSNPSDALYYKVIEHASERGNCDRIVNPGIRGGGLDHFKEQFLFRRTTVPMFVSFPAVFRAGKRFFDLKRTLRKRASTLLSRRKTTD